MTERRRTHETGRAGARPGRVGRTPVAARVAAALLVFVASLSIMMPERAIAGDTSYSADVPSPRSVYLDASSDPVNAVAMCANVFQAALYSLGYSPSQIDDTMAAKLSSQSSGGRFYQYAQTFFLVNGYDNVPDWVPTYVVGGFALNDIFYDIWGYTWFSSVSKQLYDGAAEDLLIIYNGGSLSGGSVSDLQGYHGFALTSIPYNSNYLWTTSYKIRVTDVNRNTESLELRSDVVSKLSAIYINDATYNAISSRIGSIGNGFDIYGGLTNGRISNNNSLTNFQGNISFASSSGSSLQVTENDKSVRVSATPSGALIWQYYPMDFYIYKDNDFYYLKCDQNRTDWTSTASFVDFSYFAFTSGAGGGGGGGGGGDTIWPGEPLPEPPSPDPPDPPDPIDRPVGGNPDIPEPGDPTVPETPQPGNPTTNIYVNVQEPTNTSPNDYTPWLRAILQAINNLGDKLNQESLEIQRALNTFYTNLVSSLKSISGSFLQDLTSWGRQQMQWLSDDLAYSLEMFGADLTEYLDELAQWVVDNLNFDFPNAEFDDSSIVYWLKRIWSKLGNGNINTRPTDPTEDPDGFLEWIRKVIAEFILGLGSSASSVVSDIGDLLSRLFAKFPFSVPWDILAVLGLLDAPTATPRIVIDVPITIGSWHTTYTFDVNLQPYDSAMATARSVFLILFCSWLLWLTPQVLRDLSPEDFL